MSLAIAICAFAVIRRQINHKRRIIRTVTERVMGIKNRKSYGIMLNDKRNRCRRRLLCDVGYLGYMKNLE